MSLKQAFLGIVSIALCIPFYIFVRLTYTTERLDKFLQQNFLLATITVFIILPALIVGFAIVAIKQKDRYKPLAYLSGTISVPVFLFSLYRLVISIAYIILAISSR